MEEDTSGSRDGHNKIKIFVRCLGLILSDTIAPLPYWPVTAAARPPVYICGDHAAVE